MGRQSGVTVLICEHSLLREGLSRILSAADFRVAAAAAHVNDLEPASLSSEELILLVLNVSNDQDATIAQVKAFRAQYPRSRVALLADDARLSDENMATAFRCGADAYFLKPSCDTFLKSLELVMLGETILPPKILSFFLCQREEGPVAEVEATLKVVNAPVADGKTPISRVPRLSAREQCILRHLIEGASNKAIARKNDIAEATVKVHVKAILRKIRVSNRTQAAIWGMNHDALLDGSSSVLTSWDGTSAIDRGEIVDFVERRRAAGASA
jgi:two-component system, NarL family, nitrate/nitrite response regulator NarL